jgi:alpha-L-rhamnosidase
MRNRPPFIWTPKQRISKRAFLAHAPDKPERHDGNNRWFLFRRTIDLAIRPDTASIKITCDGRYQLFVNGVRVGRGPVRSAAMMLKYDTYDISGHLVAGTNVMAVLLHTYGVDTSWYERVRGMWAPTFGDGGLWVAGDGGAEPFSSGPGWKVFETTAWTQDTERMNSGLGFIESFDARRLDPEWTRSDFGDSDWDDVSILHVDGGGPDAFFGGLDIEPFPTLLANPLPPLVEIEKRPARLFRAYRMGPAGELPLHRLAYEEPILGDLSGVASNWNADRPTDLKIDQGDGEAVSLLFKFDELLTGYPFIEITCEESAEIDIFVRESIAGEYEGDLADQPRIPRIPMLGHDAHLARLTTRKGHQRFERFEWSAVRWIQVTVRNAPGGFVLHDVGVIHTHFPTKAEGAFTCDDSLLNQLWTLGRTTLQLCMHDGWEDCPSREQRQWLGDVTVEHAAAQAAFGPSANKLTAKYLIDVADSQRPDGLTQMYAPGDHGVNGILIPDWTLQWILTAGDYLTYTGDEATIEAVFPAIQRALEWFERLRVSNGLVADLPYWHFMDWSAVGRKGEAATLNAQLAGALQAAADLARVLENPRAMRTYSARATEIQRALNARHWDKARGVYVDMVNPGTGQQNPRVSQHANAAMILWGNAPADRWSNMIERITDPSRVTFTAGPPVAPNGEPLDEVEGVVLANTFYSHFVYAALGKARRIDKALELMRARYGPMLNAGAVSLWESYGPTASLCHGFSASPTWQMTTHILGLKPHGQGMSHMEFAPDLGDLNAAEGKLSTVRGDIVVSLKRITKGIEARLTLPPGVDGVIGDGFAETGGRLESGRTHALALTLIR